MIGEIDFIKKYMIETILHEKEIEKRLKEKLLQTQEVQTNMLKAVDASSVLSKEDLKDTRIEHGFKQAFMSIFGQDDETFTSTIQMKNKYLVEYTGIEVKHFKDTLLQHIESKVDRGKALDAGLVVTESSVTESEVQDASSRSGNDTDTDDVDIRPIYDEEPMAEEQLTAECNIFATGQQHTEQPELNNKRGVDQYTKQCQVKSLLLDPSLDNKTTKISNQSLESENIWKRALQPLRNQSVVRQLNAFKSERPKYSKPRFASQFDVKEDLSKPVTTYYLPKERESAFAKPHHVIASS
ncbi:hypothetical protein Tco_0668399 [Tanacetum coccineum]